MRTTHTGLFKFIFLVFALVFGGAAVGIIAGVILPEQGDAKIVKFGTYAIAVVIDYDSNLTVDDVDYYYLTFRWTDEDGNTHIGRTNSVYLRNEAAMLMNDTDFPIKVLDGKAVAADYRESQMGFVWIIIIPFFAVSIGMGVAFVRAVITEARSRRIMEQGQDAEGIYISSRVGIYINNVPRYKMKFSFKDTAGVEHIVNTPSQFDIYKISILETLGKFPVRYIDKNAVIKLDGIDFQKYEELMRTGRSREIMRDVGEGREVPAVLDGYVNPSAEDDGIGAPMSYGRPHGAVAEPAEKAVDSTDLYTYNKALTEIKKQRTHNAMLDVLDKHRPDITDNTYYKLKDDIEALRASRKL